MSKHETERTRPVFKSLGGKTRLLPELLKRIPPFPMRLRYHEPFVGGGALFFALAAQGRIAKAWLGDMNADLIAAYLAVKNEPEALITRLRRMEKANDEAFYYRTRAKQPADDLGIARGARFAYLNKTSYNGLWRVNQKGEMNAPCAKYANTTICDVGLIRATSDALHRVRIGWESWEAVMPRVKPGDVVYFDPPYVPVREARGASFAEYTVDGFTWGDQMHLVRTAIDLGSHGVHVLLSNSTAPALEEVYRGFLGDSLHVDRVHAPRSVNNKGTERGVVPELLAYAGPGIGEWPWKTRAQQA